MWCRDQRKGKERLKMDQAICLCQESYGLGTGQATKTDEFSENFQRGEGFIFNPKIYVAYFGPLYRAFLTFSE